MKAVILAGGQGTRMGGGEERTPKPMVEIGGQPILWHLLKILSSQGLQDFVVATGFRSHVIKKYFLDYELMSHDFSLEIGKVSRPTLYPRGDHEDWSVSVIDTGRLTETAERILLLKEVLGNRPFLVTYGDGLADVKLDRVLDVHQRNGRLATITVSRAPSRFGVVSVDRMGVVESFREKQMFDQLVNIGYMIFEPEALSFFMPGESLENGPLTRLAQVNQLSAHVHEGFWQPMDTQRELQTLRDLWDSGRAPWSLW